MTEAAKTVRGMKWAHVTEFAMLLDGKTNGRDESRLSLYVKIDAGGRPVLGDPEE